MGSWFTADEDNDSILAMPRGVLVGLLTVFCVVTTVGMAVWGPEDWGWIRTGLGGLLLGAMSFYMLFINRILIS